MERITVNDIPLWGKFTVISITTKKVLHSFDGEGHGDISPDVAFRSVAAMYASDDTTIIEVED